MDIIPFISKLAQNVATSIANPELFPRFDRNKSYIFGILVKKHNKIS